MTLSLPISEFVIDGDKLVHTAQLCILAYLPDHAKLRCLLFSFQHQIYTVCNIHALYSNDSVHKIACRGHRSISMHIA